MFLPKDPSQVSSFTRVLTLLSIHGGQDSDQRCHGVLQPIIRSARFSMGDVWRGSKRSFTLGDLVHFYGDQNTPPKMKVESGQGLQCGSCPSTHRVINEMHCTIFKTNVYCLVNLLSSYHVVVV